MPDVDEVTAPPGSIYTFYSYKGGVGRSMALVNIGVLMALAGHRVLLVDWDLEAPGLEVYFRKYAKFSRPTEQAPGIVDLLEGRAGKRNISWRECINTVTFQGGSLDLISAGRRSEDYRQRVQRLDWSTLYREHGIGNYIAGLRDEWREKYGFVLIDSRTGVTDIGDICTVLLPDVLVLMFVTNFQNIEGIHSVMTRAVAARAKVPDDLSMLLGLPLPSRIEPNSEYKGWVEWNERFAREFMGYFRDWLPKDVDPLDVVNKLYIPYVTVWSFGERIPVLENAHELQNPASVGAAYSRVATLLMNKLDWYSLEGRSSAAEIQGTRAALQRARSEAIDKGEELQQVRRGQRRKIVFSIAGGVAGTFLLGLSLWWSGYQDYTIRGQVQEGLALANNAKVDVAQYFALQGKMPSSNSEAGVLDQLTDSRYVKSVDVLDQGQIAVKYAPGLTSIGGSTLQFTPVIDPNRDVRWICSSQDIGEKYLPTGCQKGDVLVGGGGALPPPSESRPVSAGNVPKKAQTLTNTRETYYVVALTSNDCADAERAISTVESRTKKSAKALFPGIGTYEPQGYQCTLLLNGAPLSKQDAAAVKRRAIEAGFGTDTWLMDSGDPYFNEKNGLGVRPRS